VRAGDRVGLWLPNSPEWLVLFLACARIGAIAVSIDTRFRAHEIADIVARAGCSVLALSPGFKALDFAGILAEVPDATLAGVAHTIVVDAGHDARRLPGAVRPYAALLAGAPDTRPPAGADARCVIFTTSGTTSAPKFACHVQGAVTRHARDVARGFGFDAPGAAVLQALPLCGVFGFTQALAALAGGARVVMQPVFEASACVASIERHGITHMCGGDDKVARMLDATPRTPRFRRCATSRTRASTRRSRTSPSAPPRAGWCCAACTA